jgi:anhydro-N-acetylmuramic acid kinase
MIVAGVMSGTSADGINVAIVRIMGKQFGTRLSLITHEEFSYPTRVRKAVLAAMNAKTTSVGELSRLNFLLGELYAEAVLATQRKHRISKLDLVGCHGQTIYHQGEACEYLGRKVTATWQTGEGAVIAARAGVPVVSDFRPADLAAGGKGAPLVPLLDYLIYRHRTRGRILQNIGGVANLTALPAGGKPQDMVSFDTGPGNMVIDALMERLYRKPMDRDGKIAASGTVLDTVVSEFMRGRFLQQKPPRTGGREEFGREFVARLLSRCGRARKQDVLATATALTAHSIAHALKTFVMAREGTFKDYIVTGGGAKNCTLIAMVKKQLLPFGLHWKRSEDFGIPGDAKEAVAFAVLAYHTWQRQPGNIPAATGASRPAILGKISYA